MPLYPHDPVMTLMRTTPKECPLIGTRITEQLDRVTGRIVLMLPLRGVSAIDKAGHPFHDLDADGALFAALRAGAAPHVRMMEVDVHIDDVAFANAVSAQLCELLRERGAALPRRKEC